MQVAAGCISPLCDILSTPDPKVIEVALDALSNILRVGREDAESVDLRFTPHKHKEEEGKKRKKKEAFCLIFAFSRLPSAYQKPVLIFY
jgi:hypothetical protein